MCKHKNVKMQTINVDKTNALPFFNKLPSTTVPIRIGNGTVHLAPSSEYFEIHLDSKLIFSDHVSYVTGMLARNSMILFKNVLVYLDRLD